jgi:hypothetical protein
MPYAYSMSLAAIKDAIRHLSEPDRTALETWLTQEWGAQIERDFSPGGAGMKILADVDAEIEAGNVDRFKVIRPRG